MVSKTVLTAFAALLCAQAFVSAAPFEEKERLGKFNLITCIKDFIGSANSAGEFTFVQDIIDSVNEIKAIRNKIESEKEECSEKYANDATAIADCQKKVDDASQDAIDQEKSTIQKRFTADWTTIKTMLSDCNVWDD